MGPGTVLLALFKGTPVTVLPLAPSPFCLGDRPERVHARVCLRFLPVREQWIGSGSDSLGNSLKVSSITFFGVNDLYFSTTVTMQNTGPNVLYEVRTAAVYMGVCLLLLLLLLLLLSLLLSLLLL